MSIHIDRYFALKLRRRTEKSYQACYIDAHLQQKKEMCMSPRQMRIYWEEPSMDVSPAGCYSRVLKYRFPLWSHLLARKKATFIGRQNGKEEN